MPGIVQTVSIVRERCGTSLEEPEKIKIRHRPVRYEGIVANSAVAMALYESIGLGRLIDRRCRFRPGHRIMSPGIVVKALIGPTFNIHEKFPLYLVNKAYQSAPGPSVITMHLHAEVPELSKSRTSCVSNRR